VLGRVAMSTDIVGLLSAAESNLADSSSHRVMSQLPTHTPPRLAHVLQITPVCTSAAVTVPSPAAPTTLVEYLHALPCLQSDSSLAHLLLALADAAAAIAHILRDTHVSKLRSANVFGDVQLNVDVAAHETVVAHLRASGVCATASSEEDPTRIDLSDSLRPTVGRERVFAVGFDPLDGSSIIDANFAVGSVATAQRR
jgi:hypothetical protein